VIVLDASADNLFKLAREGDVYTLQAKKLAPGSYALTYRVNGGTTLKSIAFARSYGRSPGRDGSEKDCGLKAMIR